MTKAGWENSVLEELKCTDGYFTVFYATSNQFIAHAFNRLEASGKITIETLGYPVSRATIKE